jgi:hypothetical protein
VADNDFFLGLCRQYQTKQHDNGDDDLMKFHIGPVVINFVCAVQSRAEIFSGGLKFDREAIGLNALRW